MKKKTNQKPNKRKLKSYHLTNKKNSELGHLVEDMYNLNRYNARPNDQTLKPKEKKIK